MKDRLFWIPTLIILATPIVVAVVCMILEVRWQTWIALASGMEPITSNELTPPQSTRESSERTFGRRKRLSRGTRSYPVDRFGARVCCKEGVFDR